MFEMEIIATMDHKNPDARTITGDGQALANAMFVLAMGSDGTVDENGIPAVIIQDDWSMGERMRHGLRHWFEASVGPVEMESDVDLRYGTAWLISTDEVGRQRADVKIIGSVLSVTISEPTTTATGWRPVRRYILSVNYNYHSAHYNRHANGGE